jgi:peptidoglycan/xylan/chitin deacetylase (PgdA/CDA1 family)
VGHATSRIALLLTLTSASLSLFAESARSAEGTLTVLFDLDRDSGSGCTSSTPEGPVDGIELRLTTTIDLATDEVVSNTHASCVDPIGSAFGAEVPVTGAATPPWDLVVGNGTSGSALIETYLPLSAAPGASIVHAYASFAAAVGSDALLAPDGSGAGGILVVMRPPLVPTLSPWGFALLTVSIAVAAASLRRRVWIAWVLVVIASPLAVRAGLGDGTLRIWPSHDQVATDVPGDAPEGADILGLFAAPGQDALLLRMDVFLGPPVCLSWETVDPGTGFPCTQEPPPDQGPFGNAVALTFDDGPNPATTPSILATLRAENIPATFFQQGLRLETAAQQALSLEIHQDPLFRVVNHSYSHTAFPTLTVEQMRDELTTTSDLIRAAIEDPCYHPRLFRFPFGAADCASVEVVREQGLSIVGVHMDAVDWCFASGGGFCPPSSVSWMPDQYRDDLPGWVVNRLQQTGGGIVLMHDIHANTAAELPNVISALRAAGATFVDLDDAALFPILNAEINPPEPPACCNGVVN